MAAGNKRKAPAAKAPIPTVASSKASTSKQQTSKPTKKARFEGPAAVAPVVKAVAPKKTWTKKEPKVPKAVPTPAAPTTFIVTVGSYERLLYGLSCSFSPLDSTTTSLPYTLEVEPVFSFPAHLSSLRTVAGSLLPSPGTGSERKVGGKYLVSGGTDEVVKVWDLKRKKEVGSLEGEAAGTITCLRFVAQRNILLAASSDSAITMYRVRDWVLLRQLKGHKGRVNSIDAHPAGRVALSVGQDKMLRMWDLVAGKAVATLKVGAEGDVVRWNTDGTKFAIICGSTVTVYGIDMSVHHTLTAPSRFHDVRFCYFPIDAADPTQCEYLFIACEDGKTRIFDVTASKGAPVGEESSEPPLEAFAQLVGHSNRVKMIDLLEVALPAIPSHPTLPTSTIIISTASSDGLINLYDMATLPILRAAHPHVPGGTPFDVVPSGSHDTDGSRLTCICAIGMAPVVKKGEGKEGEDEVVDEDDEEEEDEESGSESEGEDSEEGGMEEGSGEEEEELAFDDEEELDFEEE